MRRLMESLKIIAFCIFSACLYGIAHDQITARVCVEYFTIGHPRILDTDSPLLLGIAWGIVATWWVGALLGCAIAIVARAGSRPKLSPSEVARPVVILMLVAAVSALLAGLVGYSLGKEGHVFLLEPIASRVSREKHAAFLANLWAHSASYLVGFIGGVVVCAKLYRRRSQASV
jgi:hypothetical protein